MEPQIAVKEISLREAEVEVVSRYELRHLFPNKLVRVQHGAWYDVAVGPHRKRGPLTVIRMQATENASLYMRTRTLIPMKNELGGVIHVRKTDVLRLADQEAK